LGKRPLTINSIWLKASLLGSAWGSSEIIIGSFLHNIRLPFAGTILASIGVAILVAGQYLWNERGLIWRAGLICALMKSISPSAVIIGPMIGIVSESIVLELSFSLFRGTTIGFFIGGGIAACLPFMQILVGLLITFGFNIAQLYQMVYKFAENNVRIHVLGAYDLLAIFLLLNVLIGLIAAWFGIAMGKKAVTGTFELPSGDSTISILTKQSEGSPQKYSLALLALNVLLIPAVLLAITYVSLLWSAVVVILCISTMIFLYPRIWNRFKKPRLWIEFVSITLLAGLLLGGLNSNQAGWTWYGLVAGLQMILRGSFMIVAFSVISIELRNPTIINWFLHRGMGQLSEAMEMAFAALPTMAATLGDQKKIFRDPVNSLSRLLVAAKIRLQEIELARPSQKHYYILTGDKGIGKTTLVSALVSELLAKEFTPGGILQPRSWDNEECTGYDIANILTKKQLPLCRINHTGTEVAVGSYSFFKDGIEHGNKALKFSGLNKCDCIIIDEVGPLELEGKGWSQSLDQITASASCPILLVVRESLCDRVTNRWKFQADSVWKLEKHNSAELLKELLKQLTQSLSA
jgi:nucleoside-triphosphatase THEP1